MSRIDRIRRTSLIGGGIVADNDHADEVFESKTETSSMQPPPRPPAGGERHGAAIFAAQLMGQEGQKRGLRAGPLHIGRAQGAYNKVEWSGSKDRRTPAGRNAKTEI
ncbi:hypothetical protein [Phenylobacterium sp.]|uniref:hypothetical protein n=1 Tax=Phenylobacterium sp. TaxID=1871053 RepID=UPI00391C591C